MAVWPDTLAGINRCEPGRAGTSELPTCRRQPASGEAASVARLPIGMASRLAEIAGRPGLGECVGRNESRGGEKAGVVSTVFALRRRPTSRRALGR